MDSPALRALAEVHGRGPVLAAARAELASRRAADPAEAFDRVLFEDHCRAVLDKLATPHLKPVFNLTGTVLHTNLGRALAPPEAVQAVVEAMSRPVNLEYDLGDGQRGDRDDHIEGLLLELTGADAATAVNNNAAAVLLVLSTLASGKEVLVSRGELIEIGGAFRIPDIMRRAGARLVEVGTTNRTHLRDYAEAITPRTALVMKVHTSNYAVQGFTATVPEADLAGLCRERGIPFAVDLGSGTLVDLTRWGLPAEPTPAQAVAHGAQLVTFSGDKLLGGPQAGLLVGRAAAVARVRRHPLLRALRLDKVTLAGLMATLAHYERGEALRELPIWRAMARPLEAIEEEARGWLEALGGAAPGARVRPAASAVGGGTLPGETLPTAVLAIPSPDPDALAARLRRQDPPVVGRIEAGELLLDPRTVQPGEGLAVVAALRAALG
jgi:L-seryl-tRNA(Ser) seleniumtransferase